MQYLKAEPVYHTFLLSDLECYGFEHEFQQVYMQEKEGICEGVVLRYYNNLILSEFIEKPECKKIAELVTSEITTVMGKGENVEQVMRCVDRKWEIIYNTLYVHQNMKSLEKKVGEIRRAEKKDIERIYEFLMTFPEMRALYAEKGMIENRICGKEGFHIIMEKEGEIIAHGNSAATTDQTCMMGGICVAQDMRKKGYTIGSIGDCASYNFVLSFFSFFMTTVAGVSPAVAGTIISVAIVWDAITDPIIGYVIDHSKNKHGKRRPWILRSLIPLGASIVLMFLNVDLPQTSKNIYYLILVLVFWTAYTAFNIPFYSFGAVITDVDSERVKLSAFREVLGYVGTFCASSVPTFIVGKMLDAGVSQEKSWFTVGILVAAIAVSTIFLMWKFTAGKESEEEVIETENINVRGFLKNILSLMKMKPYVLVILCALMTNVYMTLFNSSLLYYVTYNMGMGETQASYMFTAMTIVSIVFVPFVTKSVAVFSKNKVFVGCMAFSGIAMVLVKFTGIPNVIVGCIYVILVGVGTCAYWMCIFNFLYDVVDYDEFNRGKKRDGIIMSYYSFLLKLGGAAAAAVQGVLLSSSGFDASQSIQNPQALGMIEAMFTIIPGICVLIAGLVMAFTPLQDKRMNCLREALENKRIGKPYSTKGFEMLVAENGKEN